MGDYNRLNIAVLNIVNTEHDPDKEGKYELAVTPVFVMQRREKQRRHDDRRDVIFKQLHHTGEQISPEDQFFGNAGSERNKKYHHGVTL